MSRNGLLATKFALPGSPPGAIERPRLLDALDRCAACPLTLVAAPAGSGKSALVAEWVKQGRAPGAVAWMALDAGDAEPLRFWDGVLSALARADGDTPLASLAVHPRERSNVVLPALVEALEGRTTPITLVLDDFQEAGDTIQGDLALLLRFPLDALRLVVLTRADPQLGLSRLRLQGQLGEVRAGDLAFTAGEVAELLAAQRISLPADDATRLWRRTEGWAAALRLATLSLKGHPEPRQFVERFAGTDASVSDYLISEVLAHQPADLREFLLRTSIVDVFNADLADALTADGSGHRLLARLEHGEALIVPVDEHGEWHRYHPLFAELLRAELTWERPDEVAELHRRAAVWLAAHGDLPQAVRHATHGEAWELAGQLVCDHWVQMLIDGELGALRPALEGMPVERIEADPELALAFGGLMLTDGDYVAAERHFDLARANIDRVAAARRRQFAITMAMARLYHGRQHGHLHAALITARQLLADSPGLESDVVAAQLRSLVLVNLGIVELWTGELDAAVDHLQRGHAAAVESSRDWLVLQASAHLAVAAAVRGEIGRAVRRAEEAVALAQRRGWMTTWPAGAALAALGAVNIHRGRLEEAERLLALAGTALHDTRERPLRAAHALNRALLLGDRGEPEAALDVLRAARDELDDWPVLPALRGLLTTQEALLNALVGEPGAARAALERAEREDPGSALVHVARARLALLEGDPRAMRAAVAPALEQEPGTLLSVRTEAWLLDALALDALSEHDEAARSLERALDLAEPAGLQRAIVMYGPTVRPLLNRHRRRGTRHPVLVGEALETIERRGAHRRGPASLREPLSDREQAILRFLPTMMSNQEIAGELFVSVNTVKTHLKAIYRKLDAPGRREAVTRARESGLLP